MSELTPCNCCSLEDIKVMAKKDNLKVTTLPYADGIECYAHPEKVDMEELTHIQLQNYFKAWFMELTDHCIC